LRLNSIKKVRAFALILFFSFLHANNGYFFKDEVINIPAVNKEIQEIGEEVFNKTGVSLYVVALKSIGDNNLSTIKQKFEQDFKKPYITIFFSEEIDKPHGLVEIFNSPESKEMFDEEQVLSPYSWSGTILPILASKIKQNVSEKYGVAMVNGYSDIAEQVGDFHNIELETLAGNSNRYFIFFLKAIFYSVIIMALTYYIYKKLFKRDKE